MAMSENDSSADRDGIVVGLSALCWTLEDPARADRLIALTGMTPADLRALAEDSAVLAAVLGPLLAGTAVPLGEEDASWLIGPADESLSPEDRADLDAELEQAQRVIADEADD